MLPSLSEFFGKRRRPSGYRPGVTLGHVRRNLANLSFEALAGEGRGRFSVPGQPLSFEVQERTHSELLMHLVLTDFVLRVPARGSDAFALDIRHTGALKRNGIACRQRKGEAAELARLEAKLKGDEELFSALMLLDFKHLAICREADGWCVTLEHIGASEVVNRMPSFRRYVRLSDTQRDALLGSFLALQRVLGGF